MHRIDNDDNPWSKGDYLTEMSQTLGLSKSKVLQYINNGILKLNEDGLIDMETARKRINRYIKKAFKDPDVANYNLAIWSRTTGQTKSQVVPVDQWEITLNDKNIQVVRKLLADGASEYQILSGLIKTGMTYEDAKNLYRSGVASFKTSKVIDTDFEVQRAYARFEDMYAMARKQEDYQSCLVIQREFMNTFKIEPKAPPKPTRSIAEMESDSGIERVGVYIPDNSRDPDLVNQSSIIYEDLGKDGNEEVDNNDAKRIDDANKGDNDG
jgi:hypothetical protein